MQVGPTGLISVFIYPRKAKFYLDLILVFHFLPKSGKWVKYVFPSLKVLGRSWMAIVVFLHITEGWANNSCESESAILQFYESNWISEKDNWMVVSKLRRKSKVSPIYHFQNTFYFSTTLSIYPLEVITKLFHFSFV